MVFTGLWPVVKWNMVKNKRVNIILNKSDSEKGKYILGLDDGVIDNVVFLSPVEVIELAKKLKELGF